MIRKSSSSSRGHDAWFTIIELLVVMIIIGVLATIAIVFLPSQEATAHAASVEAGVSASGQEIAGYHVDGGSGSNLDLTVHAGRAGLSDDAGVRPSIVLTEGAAVPTSGGLVRLEDPAAWCVAHTGSAGVVRAFPHSAGTGLEAGTC